MMLVNEYAPLSSTYYIGGELIRILKRLPSKNINLFELFMLLKEQNKNCSFNDFGLALNWLFILGLVDYSTDGELQKCL